MGFSVLKKISLVKIPKYFTDHWPMLRKTLVSHILDKALASKNTDYINLVLCISDTKVYLQCHSITLVPKRWRLCSGCSNVTTESHLHLRTYSGKTKACAFKLGISPNIHAYIYKRHGEILSTFLSTDLL